MLVHAAANFQNFQNVMTFAMLAVSFSELNRHHGRQTCLPTRQGGPASVPTRLQRIFQEQRRSSIY
jgi:hypothetical protein